MEIKKGFADHKKGNFWNGTKFTISEDGIPSNLTGYKIRMAFKASTTSSIIFEFNTDNGSIILSPTEGEAIVLGKIINFNSGRYLFDVELTPPNGQIRNSPIASWNIVETVT